MKGFFRQRGALLLVIALVLTALLCAGAFMTKGRAGPLTNAVNTVLSPVRGAAAAVMDWGEDLVGSILHYQETEEEMESLRQQVADLQEQVRELESQGRENEQLRQLLDLKSRRRELVMDIARVTSHSASGWESTLTISRGSADGVEPGDCVVTAGGILAGTVTEVGLDWSTVSTVINTDTELGGVVLRTWASGILEGDFTLMQEGRLKLSYLPEDAQIMAGDEVVTSGRGDVYPPDLVVGTVEKVCEDESGVTRYAVIVPGTDLNALSEVAVIKDFTVER